VPAKLTDRARVLVLGGTAFVGRAIVEDAVHSCADVTPFGRGKTGVGLFPQFTRLTGDRGAGDYAALRDGSWDAVVDVSGYVPRHVNQAMHALGGRVGRYVFISSHAVYRREGAEPGSTEDAPRRPPRRDTEVLDDETYGPLIEGAAADRPARATSPVLEDPAGCRPGRAAWAGELWLLAAYRR
jgi:2'-hydroxyisoflavone reductase